MSSTVRVRVGEVELEYQGGNDYTKEDLSDLLTTVTGVAKKAGGSVATAPQAAASANSDQGSLQATTGTIAAKLNVKSGPELIVAAAARLKFGLGQKSFDRKAIAQEMKSANAYYKKTYMNNLSAYLQRCVKDDLLREVNHGQYSLSAKKCQELESQLAA